ncbi:MAG: dihydropteroate synthase [Verrucomicrobiae bacterium]|nr:dihydropteroate synthase [Verrucomicrobiae bacterium]
MLDLNYLAELRDRYTDALSVKVPAFTLRNKIFDFQKQPHLMGVINLSPDSWYRESVCLTENQAIQRSQLLTLQGADLIDIGAESTLNHAAQIDETLQTSRLIPVIRELNQKNILISVETYQPAVAQACFEAGAAVLNLTGNFESDDLYRPVAEYDGALILCYVQGAHVRAVDNFSFANDMITIMKDYFLPKIDRAQKLGVKRIFLDPGLGFYYKNLQDSERRIRYQMEIFLQTFRLRQLGWPVCHALPHAFENFEEEVRCAEPFFATLALLGKTDLLRTHEIAKVKAVIKTLNALG